MALRILIADDHAVVADGIRHLLAAQTDLEQLKAFAEQAAVAIQNVRRWDRVKEQLQATASMNTRLMGRERYINQLLFRIQQLEQELGRYKAA